MIRSARRALPAGAGRREQHVLHHQVGSSEGEAGEGDAARAGGARPRAVFRRARAPQGRAGKPRTSDRANGLPRARPPPLRRATSAHSSRRPARAQASASIVVSSELVAYCCDRETFTTFFGSVQRSSTRRWSAGSGSERACVKVPRAAAAAATATPPPPPPRICRRCRRPTAHCEGRRPPRTPDEQAQQRRRRLSDLEHRRILGVGTFGRVRLVKHKPTNKAFALKAMRKQQVPSDPSTSSPALLAP